MAVRLASYQFRAARHPWDEWLDGAAWRLEQGVDFTGSIDTVLKGARRQAAKRGMVVRSHREAAGVVVIQAQPRAGA